MQFCSVIARDWKTTFKTVVGILSLFAIVFILPGPAEARDYQIRASDGEIYTVTLGESPNVYNFSVQKSNGEILQGVTETERATTAELYSAAKLLWHVLPLYSPDTPVKDLEKQVTDITKGAIIKLIAKQGLDILTNGFVNGLTGAVQLILGGNLVSVVSGWIPEAINNVIADEHENRLLIDAANLTLGTAAEAVAHENALRAFFSLSYETRSRVIPMASINELWEIYYKAIEYRSLVNSLIYRYLRDPESEISLRLGGLGSIGVSLLPAGNCC